MNYIIKSLYLRNKSGGEFFISSRICLPYSALKVHEYIFSGKAIEKDYIYFADDEFYRVRYWVGHHPSIAVISINI